MDFIHTRLEEMHSTARNRTVLKLALVLQKFLHWAYALFNIYTADMINLTHDNSTYPFSYVDNISIGCASHLPVPNKWVNNGRFGQRLIT